MTIDIIVQARIGSKRLPGKVLMPIMGRPMIGYTMMSLEHCRNARNLVLAMPSADDDMAVLSIRNVWRWMSWPDEEDVAGRFLHALRIWRPDAFVRICGDSPLIDWRLVNELIGIFKSGNLDLVSNVGGGFPPGQQAEVIGARFFLENKDKLDREHVTPTLYDLVEPKRKMILAMPEPAREPPLVVDTQEDFNRAKCIIEQVDGKPWDYPWHYLHKIARQYERTRADQAAAEGSDVR